MKDIQELLAELDELDQLTLGHKIVKQIIEISIMENDDLDQLNSKLWDAEQKWMSKNIEVYKVIHKYYMKTNTRYSATF